MSTIDPWSVMASHHGLEPRQQRFQLPQHAFPPHRALVSASASNEKEIPEHLAKPFQRAAHSRLAQEAALGGAGHVSFLQERLQCVQEVEIDVA